MRYSGRVYDGPLHGQFREANSPCFFVARVDPQDIVLDMRPGAITNVQVARLEYHWSKSLRAWVFGDA